MKPDFKLSSKVLPELSLVVEPCEVTHPKADPTAPLREQQDSDQPHWAWMTLLPNRPACGILVQRLVYAQPRRELRSESPLEEQRLDARKLLHQRGDNSYEAKPGVVPSG